MYLGLANGANSSFGTTRAHTDFADAVNVLNFASHGPDGSPGSAHWVIIPNSSMETLATYIREKKNVQHGAHNPIHPQMVFLTPADVEELREIYGVPVHSFDQYPGDAVFIPAGCPHQVCTGTTLAMMLTQVRSPTTQIASRRRVTLCRSKASQERCGSRTTFEHIGSARTL